MSLPRVELFPFVWVLHKFLMRGLDLLSDFRERESGGLQHLVGLVTFWKLLTELLHVLQPLLTECLRTLLSEEGLHDSAEMRSIKRDCNTV